MARRGPAVTLTGMTTSIAIDQRRQVSFVPADPGAARTLSAEQVRTFNQNGILGPCPIFTPAEADGIRGRFDRLLAAFQASGKDSYAINGYHDRCRTIYDIASDRRLVDRVVDLIGPDVVVWATHFFCKMPGDGKRVGWHQDATYWPLTPTRTVTAWLAIDDADLGNGGMQVIPGSHRAGALPVRPSDPADGNVLWEEVPGWERLGAPVCIALRAGECTLHNDLLVHGSEPNRSARRRCGLTIRYAATAVRSWKDWNRNAILVSGRDPDGYWQHRPRPEDDRPFGEPVMIGSN